MTCATAASKDNQANSACNLLSLLHSKRVLEADEFVYLQEKCHVAGACRIRDGYGVTDPT